MGPGRDAGVGTELAGGVAGLRCPLALRAALVACESVGGVGLSLWLEQANGGGTLRPADADSDGWQRAVVHPCRVAVMWD